MILILASFNLSLFLGHVHSQLGDLKHAKDLHKRVLDIRLKNSDVGMLMSHCVTITKFVYTICKVT